MMQQDLKQMFTTYAKSLKNVDFNYFRLIKKQLTEATEEIHGRELAQQWKRTHKDLPSDEKIETEQ